MSGAVDIMMSLGGAIISISPSSITKVGEGELVTTDVPAVAHITGAALPASYSWNQRSGGGINTVSGSSPSTYFRAEGELLPTEIRSATFGITVFDANGVRTDSSDTVSVTIKGPLA